MEIIQESERPIIKAAVRAGCDGADVHIRCAYPDCGCRQHMPRVVEAALRSVCPEEPTSAWAKSMSKYGGLIQDEALRAYYAQPLWVELYGRKE